MAKAKAGGYEAVPMTAPMQPVRDVRECVHVQVAGLRPGVVTVHTAGLYVLRTVAHRASIAGQASYWGDELWADSTMVLWSERDNLGVESEQV